MLHNTHVTIARELVSAIWDQQVKGDLNTTHIPIFFIVVVQHVEHDVVVADAWGGHVLWCALGAQAATSS